MPLPFSLTPSAPAVPAAPAAPYPPMSPLEEALHVTPRLTEEILSEARALDRTQLEDLVTALLLAEVAAPTYATAPGRAAVLAGELGLAGTIPALLRCIDALPPDHPVHDTVRTALVQLGAASLEPLLAAFDACETARDRHDLAEVLARLPVRDARVREAFVRVLEEDVLSGTRFLAHHGDWRAVPALERAFDRLRASPKADCDLCAGMDLEALASTIEVLGGSLGSGQRADLERAMRRSEGFLFPSHGRPPPPAARGARPGRNDPCHCGSGKKYKRCHLDADERGLRH